MTERRYIAGILLAAVKASVVSHTGHIAGGSLGSGFHNVLMLAHLFFLGAAGYAFAVKVGV